MRNVRTLLCWLLLFAFTVNAIPVSAQTATPSSTYTYGDCSQLDKQQLRNEIERYAKQALDTPANPINVDTLVARKWAELGVDATIDSEVERAVNQVRQDEGYWSRLWSGWSPDQANQFARRIMSDTFNSPVFVAKLDELSTAIGTEIARDVQAEFARAASVAFLCLQEFVGERYSTTLFTAFEDGIRLEAAKIDLPNTTQVDVNALDVHGKALTGIGVIVVTEIARRVAINLSEQIAERVAGKIIGRVLGKAGSSLIPIAGWVIGIGLVVWDLWEGGQGALPQIQESLTSEDVKAKIRSEIATSIQDGLPQESAIAAVEISTTLLDSWDNFCTTNRYLCLVADENPAMRSMLDYVAVGDLSQLSDYVNVILATSGRSELDKAIDNGQLEQLIRLPAAATIILSDTGSITTTLAWSQVAGDQLAAVSDYQLDKRRQPGDFDSASLALLISVGEPASIDKLTLLSPQEMQTLLTLPAQSITVLARSYTTDDLRSLAQVLKQPQATPMVTLVAQVIKGETTITQLETISNAQTSPVTPTVSSAPSLFSTAAQASTSFFTSLYLSISTFFLTLTLAEGVGLGAAVLGLFAVLMALWLSRRD